MPTRSSVFSTALLLALVTLGLALSAQGEVLGATWSSTTAYPNGVALGSCLTNQDYGYVYCVGGSSGAGYVTSVDYANISSAGGIGTWKSSTDYPSSIAGESCVLSVVFVYCVGGYLGAGSPTKAVYYAQTTSSGVGTWTSTTSYPSVMALQSCVTDSGNIDCVGGYDGSSYKNNTYYTRAQLSGGLGVSWSPSQVYPISVGGPSCVTSSGYVYCVGGQNGSAGVNSVFYAPLQSTGGMGSWKSTTSYPSKIYSESCAVYAGYVYCVGGHSSTYTQLVYYAPLSASGVGAWSSTTAYPNNIEQQSCLVYSSNLYCVGGVSGSPVSKVYYDSIAPVPPQTVTSTSTSSITTTTTSTSTTTQTRTLTSNFTDTVTATSISLFTVTSATTRTSTATSVSTATKTVTTTSVSSGPPVTVTATQTLAQTQTASHAGQVQVGSETLYAAAGVGLGVVLALAATRAAHAIGARRGEGEAEAAPEESDEEDV